MSRSGQLGIAASVGLLFFTVLASVAFLGLSTDDNGNSLIVHYDWPFYQWWSYWWCCGDHPVVADGLMYSAVGAAIPSAIFAGLIFFQTNRIFIYGKFPRLTRSPASEPQPLVRGHSDNYGHAYVLHGNDEAVRQMWAAEHGLVIGEACDPTQGLKRRYNPRDRTTWGDGGKTKLLIDSCAAGPTHVRGVIIPSGGGKTSMLATTLFTERRSVVVHDPSLQLAPMFAPELFPDADRVVASPGVRAEMGHDVYVIAPARPGPNVLEPALRAIEEDDPLVDVTILSALERAVGHVPDLDDERGNGNSFFFRLGSQQLVACLLYAMLYEANVEPDIKTWATVRFPLGQSEPELRDLIKKIYETSPSSRARQLAGPMVGLVAETFSGISKGADQATQWLTIPAFATMVSGGAFPVGKIVDGRTDVFISIPLDVLEHTPALARCVVGSLIDAVLRADGRGCEVHLLMDEARRFGHFRPFKLVRDGLRKYGLLLTLYYQHANQLREQWGGQSALDEWIGSMTTLTLAGISDYDTAEWVSKSIGTMPVVAWADADNISTQAHMRRSRGWNRSYTEIMRRHKLPEELMYDMPADALIVLIKGHRPVICGAPFYYRRPEYASQLPQDRFTVERSAS